MSEPIRLICTSNSVRDTTINCDSLGIHYTVTSSEKGVDVSRWDSATNAAVFVASFELHLLKEERIQFSEDGERTSLKNFLHRGKRWFYPNDQSFTSNDEAKYIWKSTWHTLELLRDDPALTGDRNAPVLSYHRHHKPSHPSYIEIADSSVLPGLDYIIVAFLIVEKKRRDDEKGATPAFGPNAD